MAEYINREDAEKALLERCKETGYGGLTPDDIRLVMRTPWRIPAADVVERNQWIPVTERLPESGVYVLACCRVKWVGGGGRSYVCEAFYSAPKQVICSFNDDIDMEYDEETDEYYLPEGWWEVIHNWDDYSSVAIADFVTHWMPLPEPP